MTYVCICYVINAPWIWLFNESFKLLLIHGDGSGIETRTQEQHQQWELIRLSG